MKITYNLTEDVINNIFDKYDDVFLIETKKNYYVNGCMVGIIRLVVNVKKQRQYLKVGTYVLFQDCKIIWRSIIDENNNYIIIMKSHWVKAYKHDLKLPITVPIQKYIRNKEDGAMSYYKDTEVIEMNYNQYVNRRIVVDFHDTPYSLLMAYENHKKRQCKYNDYYKALNETAKQYMIEHEILKKFISAVGHKKKEYKKDWVEWKYQDRENKVIEKELDLILGDNENEDFTTAKVINLNDVRM